jgi:archaellum component FlaC
MSRSRPLLRPHVLTLAKAYAEVAQINFEQRRELEELQQQVARLHEEIRELRDITTDVVTGLRQEADRDVAALRAKLQSVLIRLSRNDERLPLH